MDFTGLPDGNSENGLDITGLPDTNAAKLRQQYRATTSSPDDAAKVFDITKRTGIPKPVVERNRPHAEKLAVEPDWDSIEAAAPVTARELAANAKLFELANDDTDNLTQLEKAMRGNGQPVLKASRGPETSFGSVVKGQLNVLPFALDRMRQGIRLELADLFGFDTVKQDALRNLDRANFRESLVTPEIQNTAGRWIYGGAANIQRVVPSIAAGIATRSPTVGLVGMGIQVQPETYGKYRARGGTPGEAALGSGVETGIEIGTEMLPMGFLVDRFGKAGAKEFIAGYLGRELPTELVAEISQGAVDTAIANPDKTWGQWADELPDTIGQTVVSTLMLSGGLAAANEAARRLALEQDKANAATQYAAALQNIAQLAAASKLRARDPQTFAEFTAAVTEDGAVQDIYLDPRALQQSGVDLEALAQVSPSVAAQYSEALATGGDIIIPVQEYASSIAGSQLDAVLTPHLRSASDALSLNEAQQFYQTQAEEFQKAATQVMEERAQDTAWQQSAKAVETKLVEQLQGAGRFTPDVNNAYAALMRDFYVTTASRMGMTPEEMYARYPLQVRADRAKGAAVMDQGLTPSFDLSFVADGNKLREYKVGDTRIVLDARADMIKVSSVRTPQAKRGNGSARAAMQALVEQADAQGVRLSLDASALDNKTNTSKLVSFYESLGFERTGRTINPLGEPEMVREPQKPTQQQPEPPSFLAQAFKTVTDALSLNEAQQFYQTQAEEFQKAATQVMEERAQDTTWQQSAKAVETKLVEQLQGAGRFTPDVNNAYAALMRDFYVTTASRMGMTPEEMYARYPLQVRADRAKGAAVMDQGNQGGREVPIDSLHLNESGQAIARGTWFWNPNYKHKNEAPVQVVRLNSGALHVLDGYHRIEQAQRDSKNTIKVEEVEVSPTIAKMLQNDGVPLADIPQATAEEAPSFLAQALKTVTDALGITQQEQAETIDVDGVARPVQNSNGQRIAQTEEGLRNFWRWFGDSEVVDGRGRPLVAYHGTNADFNAFDSDKLGNATGARTTAMGFFTTDNPILAHKFALGEGGNVLPVYVKAANTVELGYRTVKERRAPGVPKDPFISMQDAIAKIAEKPNWDSVTTSDVVAWRKRLESRGYDGVILRKTIMDGQYTARSLEDPYHDFYIVFDPTQIKSAVGNQGTFDPQDANILNQSGLDMGQFFNQSAYHGSPHNFDKFSLDKIGTGEGAQAYGYGLYFAENPEVAESYQKRLSDTGTAQRMIAEAGGDVAAAILEAERKVANYKQIIADGGGGSMSRAQGFLLLAEKNLTDLQNIRDGKEKQGALYKVEIPDEHVANFLDWDKPLSEQAPGVQEALYKSGYTHEADWMTGRELYQDTSDSLAGGPETENPDQLTSSLFNSLGIKGIKYLDGASRGKQRLVIDGAPVTGTAADYLILHKTLDKALAAVQEDIASAITTGDIAYFQGIADTLTGWEGKDIKLSDEGTRNLVVFDDSIITLTHKNGEPVTQAERDAYFQPTKGQENNRGEISFGADITKQPSVITLFKTADLSTFLHEMGHFQLEVLAHIASQPNAPAEIVSDMERVLTWFGIKGDEAVVGGEQGGELGQAPKKYPVLSRTLEDYEADPQALIDDIVGLIGEDAPVAVGLRGNYAAEIDKKPRNSWQSPDGVKSYRLPGVSTVGITADWSYAGSRELVQKIPEAIKTLRDYGYGDTDYITVITGTWHRANREGEANDIGEMIISDQNVAGYILRQGDEPTTPDPAALPQRRTALEVWNAMSLEEKRPFHEQFARGFEAYLFEGKAPTPELASLFARFRSWLVNVYKSIKALRVDISDELRGVFDRMVATEDAIREAEALRAYAPLFTGPDQVGDPQLWNDLQSAGAEATQTALDALQKRSLRDMQWLNNARSRLLKQMQRDAKEKRSAVEAEVRAEVEDMPVYKVMRFLRTGEMTAENGDKIKADIGYRLDTDALAEMYPETMLARPALEKLRGMTRKEGLHPDLVAQMFGYTSGDHLVRELVQAEPMAELIEGMTDQRTLERYGDLSSPDVIARAVDEAIHNDARAMFVATELKALTKATGPVRVITKAAKTYAEAMIARKKVRDIKPSQYTTAETRAAKAAQKALQAGDTAMAAQEKRNQLVQNYSARAAYDALDEVEKIVRYLRKFDNEGTRKNLDADYLDQIDALLERFDFRAVTNKAADKRASLMAWVEAQRAQGFDPDIPDDVLSEAMRKPYRELTMEELRGVMDSVKQIEHFGRKKKEYLTAKGEREFAKVEEKVVNSIRDNAKKTLPEQRSSDRGFLVKASSLFRTAAAIHRKFSSLARGFDGFKDGGPAWEYLVRNMNERGDFEAVENEKATMALTPMLLSVTDKANGKLTAKQYFPTLGKSFSREERISFLLNMGNEANLERLLTGERLAPAQLQEVVGTLTKADADFANQVWEYLDSFWPQIAEKQRRLTGKTPEKVEAVPFTLTLATGETVQMRGGYYPIDYDPLRSERSSADLNAEVARQIQQGLYTQAQTRRGHTKARSDSTGRPLRYDFGEVISTHVTQVIHDLAWHEYLIDANRLLRSQAIENAVRQHYGIETLKEMKDTLRDIAIGNMGMEKGAFAWNHLRYGTTISALAFNVFNTLQNITGITQSMSRIGTKWVFKGAAHWAGDIARLESSVAEIHEKSDFMRLRAKTLQREINEIRNKVSGNDSKLQASFFYLQSKTQLLVDVPTWWGAYEKAMSMDEMTEDKAVALADQAVIDAQGSGQVKDLAGIQRGGAGMKLFTSFYSFFNQTFNLTAEAYGRTNFKKPSEVALFTADMVLLYTLPALLSTLLKAAMEDDWDDEDKLAKKVIGDQISFMLGTVVGLRELSAAGKEAAGVGDGFGYTGPASVRFFSDAYRLGQQISQGEADEPFWKALNNTAGVLFHYPAGQINRTATGIVALSEGRTDNPLAVVMGAPKD